jgi:hypothetical protein
VSIWHLQDLPEKLSNLTPWPTKIGPISANYPSAVENYEWTNPLSRVTRWVCEKIDQNVAQVNFCRLNKWLSSWIKVAQNLDYFGNLRKTAQRKRWPARRKFAQSGHPAFKKQKKCFWKTRKKRKRLGDVFLSQLCPTPQTQNDRLNSDTALWRLL